MQNCFARTDASKRMLCIITNNQTTIMMNQRKMTHGSQIVSAKEVSKKAKIFSS